MGLSSKLQITFGAQIVFFCLSRRVRDAYVKILVERNVVFDPNVTDLAMKKVSSLVSIHFFHNICCKRWNNWKFKVSQKSVHDQGKMS